MRFLTVMGLSGLLVAGLAGAAQLPRTAAFEEDRTLLALEGVESDLDSLSKAVETHESAEVRRRAAGVLLMHVESLEAERIHAWLAGEIEPTVRHPLAFLLGRKGDSRGVCELRDSLSGRRTGALALIAAEYLARLGFSDGLANVETALRESVDADDPRGFGRAVSSLRHFYCLGPEAVGILAGAVREHSDVEGKALANAIHHAWLSGVPEEPLAALMDELLERTKVEEVRALVELHRSSWLWMPRASCEGVEP